MQRALFKGFAIGTSKLRRYIYNTYCEPICLFVFCVLYVRGRTRRNSKKYIDFRRSSLIVEKAAQKSCTSNNLDNGTAALLLEMTAMVAVYSVHWCRVYTDSQHWCIVYTLNYRCVSGTVTKTTSKLYI